MANKHKKVWKVISRKTNTAKGKTLSWKPNHIFYWLKLTGKYFSLTGKCFPLTRKYFPLTRKCFPLTNFPNNKQTQESLENNFSETSFRETNEAIVFLSFLVCLHTQSFLSWKLKSTNIYLCFFWFSLGIDELDNWYSACAQLVLIKSPSI